MVLTPKNINTFLFFKLPSAFLCGVRVKTITAKICIVTVKHRWINQNPFNSMYFAVQAMAAELTTGALVMAEIKQSKQKISMLVGSSKAVFTKKAVGGITFTCMDGALVSSAVESAVATGLGQSITLKSIGTNEKGEQVAEMEFDWQLKIKR